ncbi:MAG: conserved rane protein of unknown function [Sphingomonadales bacterium]|nr:conserved rane protein of unknown function [Sphingomonadales bacterium]
MAFETSTSAFGNRKLWLILLVAVSALPMLVVSIPGAADYPSHLARVFVFSQIGHGTALDGYFTVNWRWIGNLGIDLPTLLLTPMFGVEGAMRLVSALIAPLTVAGIFMLSRSVHGRVSGSAMLALPFAIAQPFLFGFLNYCLSVGLALIVAALWNHNSRNNPLRILYFAIGATIVWTAHIMGWAVLLILVAGSELASMRSLRDLAVRALRALPLLAPAIPMLFGQAGGGGRLFWSDPHILTAKAMNFVTVLKGLSMPFDLGMTAVIGIGSLLAFLWAGGRRIEPRVGTGAALLLLTALILPTTVMGSWGANLRLTPVAVMVAVMAISPAKLPSRERALIMLGASLFVLRVGWSAVQWREADRVLKARLMILDAVPAGGRMAFVSAGSTCRASWALTPDRKLGAYAVVRRNSFTNTLFQISGSDLMIIRSPADRAIWFDGSQDVAAICPAGQLDLRAVRDRMSRMAAAGFTGIWVAGISRDRIPVLPNYRVAYTRGTDTLLLR